MLVSKSIFRDYDVRGVYPGDLDAKAALLIGKALGTTFSAMQITNIVVGRDDRASSPVLAKNLIEGILSTGLNVTYIDITLTPIIHFLTCAKGFDAGVMVTASHNPKFFNGFRIDLKNAVPFYGRDLEKLWEIINSGKYHQGEGNYNEANLSLDYIEFIKSNFSFPNKLKVVVDCGSGASSFIAPKLFREMGLNVLPVYCSYDANFPHGVPDPESTIFLEDLQSKVVKNRADVGFGFDTDGDRFGLVDENGKQYSTDQVLVLFAQDVLAANPGKTVVYDVKCSKVLDELIPKFGGKSEMIRTGHPYFVEKSLAGQAILGAEYSGHIFFADKYFGYDDGVYAACRTIDLMEKTGKKLSELMGGLPHRASSPEWKLKCKDEDKFEVMEKLKQYLEDGGKFKKIITIDGVRVEVSNTGWFLVRPSNTSAYLSVRFEGKDDKELKFVAKEVLLILSQYPQVDLAGLKKFVG